MANGAFGFTEEEWYQALRLGGSEDEAREGAAELAAPNVDDLDFAMSTETLALLSVATETGRAKAEQIRSEDQRLRYTGWVQDETRSGPVSDEELAQRWAARVQAEDEAWEAVRRQIRRTLQNEGKLPNS